MSRFYPHRLRSNCTENVCYFPQAAEAGLPNPAVAAAVAYGDTAARGSFAAAATTDAIVQVSALAALESLLRVGGALLPSDTRALVDAVTLHCATCAGAAAEALSHGLETSTAAIRGVQLAGLKALAAAALTPCGGSRSAALPTAVALFRRGAVAMDPNTALFCSQVCFPVR